MNIVSKKTINSKSSQKSINNHSKNKNLEVYFENAALLMLNENFAKNSEESEDRNQNKENINQNTKVHIKKKIKGKRKQSQPRGVKRQPLSVISHKNQKVENKYNSKIHKNCGNDSKAKRSKSKNSKRSSIKPGMGKMDNPLKISFQKPSRLESSTPKLIEAVTKIYQDKMISK